MPTGAIAPEPEPTDEDIARRALDNANVGPNIIPDDNAADNRSGLRHNNITNSIFYNNNNARGNNNEEIPNLVKREDRTRRTKTKMIVIATT
jgi:hypothetical protein